MGVHSPTRTLLALLTLFSLLLVCAVPATARVRYSTTDFREGDPGDGVLSPMSSSAQAPATVPEPETVAPVDDSTSLQPGVGVICFVNVSPVHGPVLFSLAGPSWLTPLRGFQTLWPAACDGRWRHAR